MAYVTCNVVEPRQELDITARFAQAQLVAELAPRHRLRRVSAHPGGDKLVDTGLNMKAGFLVERTVNARRAKHVSEA